MFKFGLLVKIKSSSLALTCDKPKTMFELKFVRKPKSLGLAWLVSQAKLELNIKHKLELKSSFWAKNLRKLHYKMLKFPKSSKKKKK